MKYANDVRIRLTGVDAHLQFICTTPEHEHPPGEIVESIALPLATAKGLARVLQQHVEEYERRFGTIAGTGGPAVVVFQSKGTQS